MAAKRTVFAPVTAEHYRFSAGDQVWNNWLLFVEDEEAGELDEPLRIRSRYKNLVCPACHRFDHDRAFKAGFEKDVRLRARGDIVETSDGFYYVNEKFIRTIRRGGFKGVALKPVGRDGWHVVNVTRRVDAGPRVYRQSKRTCPECGRPEDGSGLVEYASQIDCPTVRGTFFTTRSTRRGMRYDDRDLFATEDVAVALKKAGVKGGAFYRMLNAGEEKTARKAEKEDKSPRIARAYFVL